MLQRNTLPALFAACFVMVSFLVYPSTLKMEAWVLWDLQRAIRCHIQDSRIIHSSCCGHLKSNVIRLNLVVYAFVKYFQASVVPIQYSPCHKWNCNRLLSTFSWISHDSKTCTLHIVAYLSRARTAEPLKQPFPSNTRSNNGTTGLCNPLLDNSSVSTLPRRRNDVTLKRYLATKWLVFSVWSARNSRTVFSVLSVPRLYNTSPGEF
jgi:hypothetical protein